MEDIKTKILQSIPIENYISRFVSLKKQGRYLVGLCPFHKEKTPSFTVTPDKGIFYCFGCGKGGNLITFVIEKEQVSFKEALEILANYAGFKISPANIQTENKYIKVLEQVHQEFQKYLLSSEGKKFYDYLLSRGLEPAIINKFQLGASSEEYEWIVKKFPQNLEELYTLGIVKKNTSNQFYDFFRNRIIFPIFNTSNHVIGFGGRVIDDSKPKYLNSPESSIFHKGSILYGLNFAIPSIRKYNEIFITEGYLDVIGLHQIDVENVVAPLGTAFTEEHKKNILRYTKNIIFMMDGDIAGRNSVQKMLLLFQEELENINVLLLPEGWDPFDLSKKIRKEEVAFSFNQLKENSISGLNFLLMNVIYLEEDIIEKFLSNDLLNFYLSIKQLIEKENIENYFKNLDLEKKQQVINKIKDFFLNIRSEILKDLLTQEIERITKLRIQQFIKPKQRQNNSFFVNSTKKTSEYIDKEKEILYIIERELLGTLIKYPQMIKNFATEIDNLNFYDDFSEFLWRVLYEKNIIMGMEIDLSLILSLLPSEQQSILIPYVMKEELKENNKNLTRIKTKGLLSDNEIENIIKELITKHRIEEINQQIKDKQKKMKIMQDNEKTYIYYEIDKLLKEKKMLSSSLRGLQ
ncbi:MAG: DNA primase [Leptospiraceae bacterium]|nr:MAG: DNA primase [Leptospiraceae bacterium]